MKKGSSIITQRIKLSNYSPQKIYKKWTLPTV